MANPRVLDRELWFVVPPEFEGGTIERLSVEAAGIIEADCTICMQCSRGGCGVDQNINSDISIIGSTGAASTFGDRACWRKLRVVGTDSGLEDRQRRLGWACTCRACRSSFWRRGAPIIWERVC